MLICNTYVYGSGSSQDQQQKLTNLLFNNPPFSKLTVGENKQPITDRNMLKSQENLESQVAAIKSKKRLSNMIAVEEIQES
ncbi:29515_t:CDS:2 [Gigaspora margarita]|uniref:29515_t:CDS:1 n=1 Tax=Gigaspora margarita TaxID=4874 RepID=A0ABN7UN69_GIGMA|nr:29515_t:CDS:2 [Gigaspora margarita]